MMQAFRFRKKTDEVAKERLLLMTEAEMIECSTEHLEQMKKELSSVINRYLGLKPEEYEIKLLMKQQ